ncbi:hypothetical protein LTR10_007926 [Elasticomyces elasticus]|nr:hypothetical protein LTR10_007926 [Elasticomyces elasticus]KAK4970925.1 hypothetical protein LTR42_007902 [Elasticomyces elasticus]
MDTSPFGKLSAELRIAIYELVISQPAAVTMRHDDVQKSFTPNAGHGPDANMFAVTRICRLFTRETAGLVYKMNNFRFEVTNVNNPFAELNQFQSLLSIEDAQLLRPALVLPLAMHYGAIGFRLPPSPVQTHDDRVDYYTLPQCLDALLTEISDDSSRALCIHLDCSIGLRGYSGNASIKIGLGVELDLQNFTATACDELDSPNQLDNLTMTWDTPEAARILYVGNSELYGFLSHFGASKTFLKDHHQNWLSSL